MAKEIVNNLKFKKYNGSFNPKKFADQLNDAYLGMKKPDGETQKYSFSPSTIGYGHGNCPRYWYMAFNGANFIDNNEAPQIANMRVGTDSHRRLQDIIKQFPEFVEEEKEIKNEYPPIKGFIDLIMNYDGQQVVGEIKTAKQEVWDTRQAEMSPSSNHLVQLLIYMKLTNSKEGFFLYENKNTQQILIIPIALNEKYKKLIDYVFDWMKDVYDNFKDGSIPTRPYVKTAYACKGCPVRKECWAKNSEDGLVDIPALDINSI